MHWLVLLTYLCLSLCLIEATLYTSWLSGPQGPFVITSIDPSTSKISRYLKFNLSMLADKGPPLFATNDTMELFFISPPVDQEDKRLWLPMFSGRNHPPSFAEFKLDTSSGNFSLVAQAPLPCTTCLVFSAHYDTKTSRVYLFFSPNNKQQDQTVLGYVDSGQHLTILNTYTFACPAPLAMVSVFDSESRNYLSQTCGGGVYLTGINVDTGAITLNVSLTDAVALTLSRSKEGTIFGIFSPQHKNEPFFATLNPQTGAISPIAKWTNVQQFDLITTTTIDNEAGVLYSVLLDHSEYENYLATVDLKTGKLIHYVQYYPPPLLSLFEL